MKEVNAMNEYVLNGCGKLIPWQRFLSSADPLIYDKTLVDLSSRGIPFSAQAVFDRYCYLYWHEYGTYAPMNLEEPYKPSVADLDDFAEFQAERHPMFEDFKPDEYVF